LAFTLTDGRASISVRHHGTPPDLFGENRGAVVEGRWTAEGYFHATQILAKHSEEYKAPHDGSPSAYKALLKTLSKDGR
jgi:cytochrome c-type biogenesis protein CcmE